MENPGIIQKEEKASRNSQVTGREQVRVTYEEEKHYEIVERTTRKKTKS